MMRPEGREFFVESGMCGQRAGSLWPSVLYLVIMDYLNSGAWLVEHIYSFIYIYRVSLLSIGYLKSGAWYIPLDG